MTLNLSVTWNDFSPSVWRRGRSSSAGRGGGRGRDGRRVAGYGLSRDSGVARGRRRHDAGHHGLSRDVAVRRRDSAARCRVCVHDRAHAVVAPTRWCHGSDAHYPVAAPDLLSSSPLTGSHGAVTCRLA